LRIKLKGRHFGTVEVIETERRWWTPSQNTTSRVPLKIAEALGTVHTRGRGLLRVRWWPVGPKLVFDQTAAQVSEIMDAPLSCGSSFK
jgi:hypothetical protein